MTYLLRLIRTLTGVSMPVSGCEVQRCYQLLPRHKPVLVSVSGECIPGFDAVGLLETSIIVIPNTLLAYRCYGP